MDRESINEELMIRHIRRALDDYHDEYPGNKRHKPPPDTIWVHLSAWGLPWRLKGREVDGVHVLSAGSPNDMDKSISVAGSNHFSYHCVRLGPPSDWQTLMDQCDILKGEGIENEIR